MFYLIRQKTQGSIRIENAHQCPSGEPAHSRVHGLQLNAGSDTDMGTIKLSQNTSGNTTLKKFN